MKIEKVTTEEIDESGRGINKLKIDGLLDGNVKIDHKTVTVETEDSFDKLLLFSCNELSKVCSQIKYEFIRDWCEFPINISISQFDGHIEDDRVIWINAEFEILSWNKPYTIKQFRDCYKKLCEELGGVNFIDLLEDEISRADFFCIEVIIEQRHLPIKKYVEIAIDALKKIHLLSIETLDNKLASEGLITLFQFPPEIKTSCNQYLMYFAQFLKDLDINADTSLKEKANNVLFTVIPKDKEQALNIIYEALSAFLYIPSYIIGDEVNSNNLAIIQLKANVYHLHSQIQLANALVEAKDQTIEALKFSNFQLQTIAFKDLNDKTQVFRNEEEILGGIVSINKFEWKGVSINFAEILRKLRRRIKKS